MKKLTWIVLSIIIIAACFIVYPKLIRHPSDRLLLLYPDGASLTVLKAWTNIAEEEGLHLDPISNNEFIYSKTLRVGNQYKGIILPDLIQTRMSPELVEHINSYVKAGGALFLVFDAGTQDSNGNPFKTGSLFSEVLGLKYATSRPDGVMTGSGSVGQDKTILNSLGIPPGKCINVPATNSYCAISSYGYGALTYPYFLTETFSDTKNLLLTTPDHQFIAGVKNVAKGKILFVNLPLTDLWRGTDSMLLHAFLHYFAVNMLQLPMLSPVPNGVGGIIMNLHAESKDTLDAFTILQKWGLFQQGPYSIDFTAGPGLNTFDDNKGLDVLHNVTSQYWIRYLASLGNAIGSDGGWAHNFYGQNANENNESEFLKYIVMNNDAMEKVLGKKIQEYVPSMGNQPNWATRYLEKAGFIAYYTTSNTGTAPTQNYRNGVFDSPSLWSFPIVPFGQYASIRDCGFANIPAELLTQWFLQSTEFVANNHVSRLIYYHPSDILFFSQYLYSIQAWLAKAKELTSTGTFHWYSMLDIANFLNTRRQVVWSVATKDSRQLFSATHPNSLVQQAWLIGKNTCAKPTITLGTGSIHDDAKDWIVIAGDTKHLEFQCEISSGNNVVNQTNHVKTPSALAPFVWQDTGLITLWFDSASTNELTQALPIMNEYGYKGAVSITVNDVGKPGFMTWDQLLQLQFSGWETASHTLSNSCDLSYYTSATTEKELIESQQIIKQHGLRAEQFVMPCGYSREQIVEQFIDKHPPIVETAMKYYASFRTLLSKRNNQLPLQDRYNLKAFEVTSTTTDKDIQDKLDQAVNEKSWLILVFQNIQDNNSGSSISESRFRSILELVKNSHLPVILPGEIIGAAS